MALAKLEMTPLDRRGRRLLQRKVKVLFNPDTYSISKSVSWGNRAPKEEIAENANTATNRRFNAPMLGFDGGGSRTMTLNLFFDVTEPVRGKQINDVRKLTNRVVEFTRINRMLGHPPIVRLTWGHAPFGSDFPFTGVVTSLTQNFTLFSERGKPLRADLNVSFMEFIDGEMDQRETDPELTTRRIQRGDTLSNIAGDVYRDPGLWRLIAEANGIDDPRQLAVGRLLSIPDVD